MNQNNEPLLRVEEISISFGGLKALNEVSLAADFPRRRRRTGLVAFRKRALLPDRWQGVGRERDNVANPRVLAASCASGIEGSPDRIPDSVTGHLARKRRLPAGVCP